MSLYDELDALYQRQLLAFDGLAEALTGAAEEEAEAAWKAARTELDRAVAAHGALGGFSATPSVELNRLARAARALARAERQGRQSGDWTPPKVAGAEGELLMAARRYSQGKIELPHLSYLSKARCGSMAAR